MHATLEQFVQGLAHLGRVFPVVGGTGVVLVGRADVGAVFDTRHVGRVGAGEVGVLALFRVQLDQHPGVDHFGAQAVVFFLRAVTPDNTLGFAQGGDLANPLLQLLVLDVFGRGGDGGVGNALRHLTILQDVTDALFRVAGLGVLPAGQSRLWAPRARRVLLESIGTNPKELACDYATPHGCESSGRQARMMWMSRIVVNVVWHDHGRTRTYT
jgi:hypothetical protein